MAELKKVILYAIIPAVIAGVFAVAPKLYDEFTEPKAVLEYRLTKGPILREGSDQKSIYAIDVINNGKKPLSKINASLKSLGKVEAINIYENTGLSSEIKNNPTTISVETLHPEESFTISLMLIAKDGQNKIDVVLRSKEVLGTEFRGTDTEKNNTPDFLSALAVALSVFIMSMYFINRFKKGGVANIFNVEKPNVLFFIAAKFGFVEIVRLYGINEGNITYLRFADMLYAKGVNGNEEEAFKVCVALKCMLLNSTIAELSRNVVIDNIKAIEGDEFSVDEINLLKERACDSSELLKLRRMIDEFSAAPAVFLSKPE